MFVFENETIVRILITGVAGFVGSNFLYYLLNKGHHIVGVDNFSTGKKEFIENAINNSNFTFLNFDLLNLRDLKKATKNIDIVFHFAANADVRFGLQHPDRDLKQNTIVTFNVLEAMRYNNVKKIIFSSTGSVYGEPNEFPTPENCAFPIQTSLYGASKLAAEGLIQAYCEGYNFQAWIFRFVSLLGERYSHGHVFDFYNKLRLDPNRLEVLGDGTQKKSYLYIKDCINAVMIAFEKSNQKINIFNLGNYEYSEVKDSVKWIIEYLGLSPEIIYLGGKRGWVGDNPFIHLDISKILNLGWKPELDIKTGIIKTISYLIDNNF